MSPARGDWVDVPSIGRRPVRQARKPGYCAGWLYTLAQVGRHRIEPGQLYVETEPSEAAGGYGFYRACLRCVGVERPDAA